MFLEIFVASFFGFRIAKVATGDIIGLANQGGTDRLYGRPKRLNGNEGIEI